MKTFSHIAVILLLVSAEAFSAVDPSQTQEQNGSLAISLLDDAISKQRTLLRSHAAGSLNHWNVSLRLVETLQSKAILLERLGASSPERKIQVKGTLVTLIGAAAPLVKDCEAHKFCARAYMLRGRAWRLVGKTAEARQDLELVVKKYADEPGAEKAILQLSQLEMDEGHYIKAIEYLEPLRKRTDLSVHAQVIERLSWAYGAKGEYAKSLALTEYAFQWVAAHPAKSGQEEAVSVSTLALNFAIFYSRGIESRLPSMTGAHAADAFFAKVPAPVLGVSLRAFPGLISDSNFALELDGFRDRMMESPVADSAVWDAMRQIVLKTAQARRLDSLNKTLDYYLSRQAEKPKFGDISPALRRVEKNLLSFLGAEKNTVSPAEKVLALRVLRQVYSLGAETAGKDRLARATFQFNLAALEFGEKNYEVARTGFRKVASLTDSGSGELKTLSKNASLEAVKAGYRHILTLLKDPAATQSPALESAVNEWEGSVAHCLRRHGAPPSLIEMNYEVSRLLLGAGYSKLSVVRLEEIVNAKISSEKSRAVRDSSLALLMTHWVEMKNWEKLADFTGRVQSSTVHNPTLYKAISDVRERAALELVGRESEERNFKKVIALVEDSRKFVRTPKVLASLFESSANAAQEQGDGELTARYLVLSQKAVPSAEVAYRLAVLEGSAAEERLQFSVAQAAYINFFEAVGSSKFDPKWTALQGRLEFLAILDSNPSFLRRLASQPVFCSNGFKANCERLFSFAAFLGGGEPGRRLAKVSYLDRAGRVTHAASKSLKEIAEIRATFHKDQSKFSGEKLSSAYIAFSVFGRLVPVTRTLLSNERTAMRSRTKLTKKPTSLTARLNALKQFEKMTASLQGSPLEEFNQAVTSELALAYREMNQDLVAFAQTFATTADSESLAALQEMADRFLTLAEENTVASPTAQEIQLASISGGPLREPLTKAVNEKKWGAARYLTELGEKSDWLSRDQAVSVRRLIASGVGQSEAGEVR